MSRFAQRFSPLRHSPYVVQAVAGEADAEVVDTIFRREISNLSSKLRDKITYAFARVTKEAGLFCCQVRLVLEERLIVNERAFATTSSEAVERSFAQLSRRFVGAPGVQQNVRRFDAGVGPGAGDVASVDTDADSRSIFRRQRQDPKMQVSA